MNLRKNAIVLLVACSVAFITLVVTRPPTHQTAPTSNDTFVYKVDSHANPSDARQAGDSAPAVAALAQIIPDFDIKNATLDNVVQFFSDTTGQNYFVNRRALNAAGIDLTMQVSVHLRNVRRSVALSRVLAEIDGANVHLGYAVNANIVTISTVDDLNSTTFTRVYDIRDLVLSQRAWSSKEAIRDTDFIGGGVGGGGSGPTGIDAPAQPATSPTSTNNPGDLINPAWYVTQDIIKLIQETVSPDSWRDAGGTIGTVAELGGRLIITQTLDGHQQVEEFLKLLRETH